MSMIKHARYPGELEGEPLVRVVRPGERVKTSSLLPAVQTFIDGLTPTLEYTYVLVNAMGYSEYYGSNSNADWYGYNPHLDFNGLLHAWDGIGQDAETDRMKGKDWPFGYPCFYNAAVYAHHKNTDPQQLGFGDVIYSAINPIMKRVELVMRVFNEEAKKKGHSNILSRIAAHERCDVSMGAKVPFDFCSICTDWAEVKRALSTFDPAQHRHPGIAVLAYHRRVKPIKGLAVTRKDYCQHMLEMPNRILPDGRKVYVYNDWPRFFDISFVWIGADRTARVMWFMSGDKPGSQSEPMKAVLDKLFAKTGQDKLASMDKAVPNGLAEAVKTDVLGTPDMTATFCALSGGDQDGVKKLFTALSTLGILPTPHEFQSLVLPLLPGGTKLKDNLDRAGLVFDDTIGGVEDTFAVDPALFDEKLAQAMVPLMPERSSYAPFLHPRLINDGSKVAHNTRFSLRSARHPVLDKLASQYNGLRISVFDQAESLMPKVASFLDPSVYLAETSKHSGLGPLLLGLPPVIHLLSSHLEKKQETGQHVGSMGRFIAENPTFTSMATIGMALRAAMAVSEAGGIGPAAAAIVDSVSKVL